MKSVKIRKARKSDFKRIQKIIFDAIKGLRLNPVLRSTLKKSYSIENIGKTWGETDIFVSEKRGVIQGSGRLKKTHEIKMIYVNPKSQRKGFGKIMIKKIEGLAKSKGFKKVHIKALPPAKGFYKKLGYEEIKKMKRGTIKMEKKLK